MKKLFLFLGFILLLFPMKHSTVIAKATFDQIIVIKPSIYVREGANVTETIMEEIYAGSIYAVVEEEKDWIKIKLNDKETGWVANWGVVEYGGANLSSHSGIVTTDGLRVRSGPGTDYKALGTLSSGEVLRITEQKNGWISFTYNGQIGWVSSQFIYQHDQPSDSKRIRITASALYVHSKVNPTSKMIDTVRKGETFSVLDKKNNRYKIKLSSKKEGWIPAWYTESVVKKNNKKQALTGKTIILDAGHGGTDSGAIGQAGTLEKQLTLATAKLAYQKLKQNGANVMLTRSSDRYITLNARANFSNLTSADAFISFHYDSNDSGNSSGIKTYYHHLNQRKLAVTIQNHLLQNDLTMNNQGVKRNSFRVLQENWQPAILLELGYINNPADEAYIQTERYQDTITDGLINGLTEYFIDR